MPRALILLLVMLATVSAVSEASASYGARSLRSSGSYSAPAFPSKRVIAVARSYVRQRAGSSFALIDTRGRLHGFAPRRRYISASVSKAMMLVAYLRQIAPRRPNGTERAALGPMMTMSDNDRADAIYARVGDGGLLAVAKRAGMRDVTVAGYWGSVFFSAADQARFFGRLPAMVPHRSRPYARRLLSSVIAGQRWGFSRPAERKGWRSYFKGGWRQTDSGSLVHEAAFFERGGQRFSLAVLTDGNPSHAYGTATLRGVAKRLFRDDPRAGSRAHRRRGSSTFEATHPACALSSRTGLGAISPGGARWSASASAPTGASGGTSSTA